MLPSFLVPLDPAAESCPRSAVFNHPTLGPAHSLWWDACEDPPEAIFLFIPGNPGLLDFYIDFLSSIRKKHSRLSVFAHAHLAHTPNLNATTSSSLDAQIQSAIEAVDAVRTTFGQVKIVLSGHSVGAWIALQVLKSRPSDIFHLFLLCPTLTHIVDTPNGRRLSWLFVSPLPSVISWLSYLARPLPLSVLFPQWSTSHRAVLRSLLNSPETIFACLSMAHEEMLRIRDLDVALLKENSDRLHLYFAREDDWVSRHKASITRLFAERHPSNIDIVEAQEGVPHAFCLKHGEEVALQCSSWLKSLAL